MDERRKFDGKSIIYKESALIIYELLACKSIVKKEKLFVNEGFKVNSFQSSSHLEERIITMTKYDAHQPLLLTQMLLRTTTQLMQDSENKEMKGVGGKDFQQQKSVRLTPVHILVQFIYLSCAAFHL